MTETIYATPTATVRPQVGAVLYLDSGLPFPDEELYRGNRHWKLDGSCVLVSPTQALGLVHTVKPGKCAAFFPGVGIVPIDGADGEPRYTWGDHLVLLRLAEPVHVPRSAPAHLSKRSVRRTLLVGYGAWTRGREQRMDGIQRTSEVRIGRPGRRWDHNLDLYWHQATNGGWLAGRNNSGGAMLAAPGDTEHVVGIIREERNRLMAGSRIGWLRGRWLGKLDGLQHAGAPPGSRTFEGRLIRVDSPAGAVERFEVPEGMRTVRVTFSADRPIRLQAELHRSAPTLEVLEELRRETGRSGRFLARSVDLEEGQRHVFVAVVPVTHSTLSPAEVQIGAGWVQKA